jgi:beta-mannosidase
VYRSAIDQNWTLRAISGTTPQHAALEGVEVPATVPGCVHTDLLAAGLIADPFDGVNERLLSWIGRATWQYSATFAGAALAEGERFDLVCDGLDTIATIVVNGAEIGRTYNQHRGYRFDLREVLLPGENTLSVTFDSALDYAERMSEQYGALPHVNEHPYNAIRKMAANFGWDWGPDVVTAGIWKPIAIERWTQTRIASVRPLVTASPGAGTVAVHVDLEHAGLEPVIVVVDLDGQRVEQVVSGDGSAVVTVVVDEPDLWWPRGYGEQPLYPIEVRLLDPHGEALDHWRSRIGFRTVRLDTTPDADGIPFTVVINDQPIFVKGVNWIPGDAFVTRLDRERYATGLEPAIAAGVNLVRVWGGGIYESDDFYDIADEQGLLVWQDFLFACAAYTEAQPLFGEVEAEARDAVTRLSPHASLVIWNGGNEDIVAYAEWAGFRHRVAGATWGDGYYTDLLPRIVAELDGTRPYSPNSPYSFGDYASPNEQNLGTVHIWDVWNQKDYTSYAEWRPRFAAEFGFQGPPAWSTLTSAVHDEPLRPFGEQMLIHQKADDGNAKLDRGLAPHLPVPAAGAEWDIDDWHWSTQLNQARAVTFGIEHFRSMQPRCAGTVLWQLNDCWPVISWSVIDGHGHAKPAWFALRNVYSERLLTIQPADDGLVVAAINDTARPWSGELVVARRDESGAVLAEETIALEVAPRTSATIAIPAALVPSAPGAVLSADATGSRRALWFAHEDVAGGLPRPELGTIVEETPTGYRVTVLAHSLLKDLALFPDRLDSAATVDECLVTLFPGETAVFEVTSSVPLDVSRLVAAPVLRTANDLFWTDAAAERLDEPDLVTVTV